MKNESKTDRAERNAIWRNAVGIKSPIKDRVWKWIYWLPFRIKWSFQYQMEVGEFYTRIPQMPLTNKQKFNRFLAKITGRLHFATEEQFYSCPPEWKEHWNWKRR